MQVSFIRLIALMVAASVVAGGLFATLMPAVQPLALRWIGYSTLFGSLLFGFTARAYADHTRRREENRLKKLGVAFFLAISFIAYVGWVGSGIDPLIRQSENHLLFPALFVVGFLGSLLGGVRKF